MSRESSDKTPSSLEAQPSKPLRVTRAPGVLGKSIYRTVRIFIKLEAAALVTIFSWLRFQGVEFAPIAKELSASVVFKLSLTLYFTCWVAGVLKDTNTQENVYASQPNKGRLPISGLVWLVVIAAVFGLFCWASTSTFREFSLSLSFFFIINVVTWRYLINKILPRTVTESKQAFQTNHYKLEKVLLVYERYLCGQWQIYRFAAGGALLLVLIVLAFSPLAGRLAIAIGFVSKYLILSLTVLAFVSVMEAWIWLIRVKISTSLALLDYLDEHYGDLVGWTMQLSKGPS